MSAGNDASPGLVIADRYILLERIGEGQSGIVYRAEHAVLRSRLAVKVLREDLAHDEAAVQRYHEFVATVASMESDHVVKISDFGRTGDGKLFAAMELLKGETLADRIAREGRMEEPKAVEILTEIADALAEAHDLDLIHGDLRPRNIFLAKKRSREIVKLLDLGLATLKPTLPTKDLRGSNAKDPKRSQTIDPRYASPEHARGLQVGRRSDIYALAIIGYELLNGTPPFVGTGTSDVLSKHLEARPLLLEDKLDTVSEHYSGAIDRALSKRPERRYPTVDRFIEALAGHGPVQETPEEKADRQRKRLTGAQVPVTSSEKTSSPAADSAKKKTAASSPVATSPAPADVQSPAQKPTPQKPTPQKATAQKATAQKPTQQKAPAQKPTPQKATAQKPTPQKATAQKPTPQKATAQKPTPQESGNPILAQAARAPQETLLGFGVTADDVAKAIAEKEAQEQRAAAEKKALQTNSTLQRRSGSAIPLAKEAESTVSLTKKKGREPTKSRGKRGKGKKSASQRITAPRTAIPKPEPTPKPIDTASKISPTASQNEPADAKAQDAKAQDAKAQDAKAKDAKTSLVATASAVVPKALDTQHLRQDVDEIAQSAKPPTPTDGHGGASTAAPTDSTNTYDDPDATRGQTGNWFAEGELAEKALVTATASQPLPAIYGSFDELDLEPRRRFSATTAIVVVVGLAVVIFGMIFMLHGSKEPTKKRRGGGELPLLVKGHRAPKIDQGTPNADMGTGTQSVAQAGSVTPAGSVAPAGSGTGSHTPETPGTSTGTKPSPQAPPVATPPPADTKPQQASLTPDKTTKTPPRSIPKKAHPQPIVHRTPPPAPKPVTPRKPRPKPLPVPRPAVAAAPKAVVRGYIREGRSQLQKGGYGKAKAAFLKALAANPRSANAQGGLGEVAFELGNYALASKHLRAAVRLNPRSGRYLVMLGNVYFKQGKIGAAVKQYRQALKFNPHNRAARTGIEAAIRRSGHGA